MAHGPTFWLPNIVQPIGTVLIGIAGSFIARRQWLTANEKFRFDLFEKRYEIYQSVDASLSSLIQQGDDNIGMGDIKNLERRITDVHLFYGSEIGIPCRALQQRLVSCLESKEPISNIECENQH